GAKDLDGLALKGIVSAADVANLKASQDFLLRVRNELHFSTGKHQDQLTFEEQQKVSQALGFEGEGTLKAVEVFMRNYYLHAAQISRLTSLIIHLLTDAPRPPVGGLYSFAKTLREGVCVSHGQLSVTKPSILESEPGNLIDVFAEMQKHRCELSHETRELLREHIGLIDERFRRSAAANVPFFTMLEWVRRFTKPSWECAVAGSSERLFPSSAGCFVWSSMTPTIFTQWTSIPSN